MPWPWIGISSCGENSTSLKINEACLEITSLLPIPIPLKTQSSECQGCALILQGEIPANSTTSFIVDTSYPLILNIQGRHTCYVTKWFEDFGLYSWTVNDTDICEDLITKESPEYFWLNIAVVSLVAFTICVLYKVACCLKKWNCYSRLIHGHTSFQEFLTDATEPESPQRNQGRAYRLARMSTIDVFRGVAISIMVFVNYGGGQYSVFQHTPWNGLTVADVVFPFFVWVMGVSTVISLRSQLRACFVRKNIFFKILRRSMTLVCLGIILNSGKGGHSSLRIPGVLQRIGLTYFIVATIELIFGKPQRSDRYGPWNVCVELVDAFLQWAVAISLVVLHLVLTFALPVPSCPTGYLGPGGLANLSENFNCTGGAAGYIDRLVFSPKHIYQRPTSQKIYYSLMPFDPEGLLGLLNSVVLAFLGAHCGRIILCYERTRSRIVRWLLWSLVLGLMAGYLCSWSKDNGIIPVNKNLWSLSYILATSSLSFALFSLLYWLIDHKRLWAGGPFLYAGMNSIAVYVGHEILNKQLPWRWTPLTNTHIELLAMDITASAFWLLTSFILYKHDIFITV